MDILNTKLIDLMPATLKSSQEIQWICASVQPEIDEIIACIDKILFTRLNYLDDLTLDYLLVECNIANSPEMTLIATRQDKINFIKNYVQLKKLKGTKAGIQYVLNLLGFRGDILEWFEYGGKPYNFQISIAGAESLPPERMKLLNALILEYKNTRSWLSYIQNVALKSTTYVAISTTINITVRDKQ
ncbi:MAG: phage tail protein [Burkholderiales bacterium]|nr:phage tail protein [Burkholderiales bacterium]